MQYFLCDKLSPYIPLLVTLMSPLKCLPLSKYSYLKCAALAVPSD